MTQEEKYDKICYPLSVIRYPLSVSSYYFFFNLLIKKISILILALGFISEFGSTSLYAAPKDQPTFSSIASISYMPATSWFIEDGGSLDYELDTNSFTTYQGEICYSRFKFGVGVDVNDNIVGKLSKVMGYLGYDFFTIRASGGKITGTANWTKGPIPGQPQSAKVDTKYRSTDLIFDFIGPSYIGISYTEYTMPAEINFGYGTYRAYDDNAKIKDYSLVIVMDTSVDAMRSKGNSFWIWWATNINIGRGTIKISNEGMRRLQEANAALPPYRRSDKQKIGSYISEGDATLGLFLKINSIGIGVGYNVFGRTALGLRGDIETSHLMAHHGIVFKIAATF